MEENINNIGKRMPYKVPEGFFEEMHGRLMEETAHLDSRPSTLSFQPSRKRFWMSAAAVVLLIAGVSFYALHRMEQVDAALLADESVETYMSDDALDEWIAIYENIDNTVL